MRVCVYFLKSMRVRVLSEVCVYVLKYACVRVRSEEYACVRVYVGVFHSFWWTYIYGVCTFF